MQQARKELIMPILMQFLHFSTKKNFTKDNTVDDVIELSNKLKENPICLKNLKLLFN